MTCSPQLQAMRATCSRPVQLVLGTMHSHVTVTGPVKQQVLIIKLPINSMVVIRDSQQAVAMVVKVTTISIP